MKRLALVWCCLLCACNAAWGIEPADSVLADAGPPTDTAPGECDPQPGVAKACITFKLQAHASYDVATGAGAQRIDGLGFLRIDVYDQDPNNPASPYVSRVRVPVDGEVKVDSFPVTWSSVIGAGKHWIIAQFEDNKNTPRTGGNNFPAGDFMTLPSRAADGRYVFPMFTAVVDEVARLDIDLVPLRRVDVDVQADPSLRTTYKDFAVNGDGPITFGVFDGPLSDTTQFLDLVSAGCASAQPMSLMPPVIKTGFTTTVTGSHNLIIAIEDYDATKQFPTSGSLITSDTTPVTLSIATNSWTGSMSAKFVKVINPFRAGEMTDTLKCP